MLERETPIALKTKDEGTSVESRSKNGAAATRGPPLARQLRPNIELRVGLRDDVSLLESNTVQVLVVRPEHVDIDTVVV